MGSPPHARGIQHTHCESFPLTGLTPACAGNTCVAGLNAKSRRAHPRMRGEYSTTSVLACLVLGSPPHARGIPIAVCRFWCSSGLTPACAGNTARHSPDTEKSLAHPRMRGEYCGRGDLRPAQPGSPPRARGILDEADRLNLQTGLTPACAGNTVKTWTHPRYPWAHPRMRGEYIVMTCPIRRDGGSPPHARGIR